MQHNIKIVTRTVDAYIHTYIHAYMPRVRNKTGNVMNSCYTDPALLLMFMCTAIPLLNLSPKKSISRLARIGFSTIRIWCLSTIGYFGVSKG